MRLLLSVFIWMVTAIMTLLVFIAIFFLVVILFPFDKKRKVLHAQGFWWADAILALNPFWNLTICGLENIDPRKTYVVVSNHQSMADIILLYKTHMQFKWVAKEDLFKVPVFGWCMARMKHIALSRGELGSIKNAYRQAAQWLRKDVSVLFFPEGTRSLTDKMNDFKNGAFKLAIKEKRPILPVLIEGSRDLLPRGSWIFKAKATCKLTVFPAIETDAFRPQDFAQLRDKVRAILS